MWFFSVNETHKSEEVQLNGCCIGKLTAGWPLGGECASPTLHKGDEQRSSVIPCLINIDRPQYLSHKAILVINKNFDSAGTRLTVQSINTGKRKRLD